MLYREAVDGFEVWQGEPINDVRHPLSIEQFWNDEELEAIGLFRNDPTAPEPEPYNPTPSNILTAPATGFGGPNGKELFNGNR